MKVKIQDSRQAQGYRIVRLNRRQAIAENCLNCSGFEYSERRNCEIMDCILFPYRTGIGKQDSRARNSAIRAYCKDTCMGGNSFTCPSVLRRIAPYTPSESVQLTKAWRSDDEAEEQSGDRAQTVFQKNRVIKRKPAPPAMGTLFVFKNARKVDGRL